MDEKKIKASEDFSFDVEQEKILCKTILDDYFDRHLKIGAETEVVDFDANPDLQFKGVDIKAILNKETMLIDLKAQTNTYIGVKGTDFRPTPTFCLELSALSKNKQVRTGWFLNDEILTTHYLFMWIYDAIVEEQEYINFAGKRAIRRFINNPEDALNYKVMLVNAIKTHKWLSAQGCTDDYCRRVDAYMRKNNVERLYFDLKTKQLTANRPSHGKSLSFVKTNKKIKEEEPINLVVHNKYWGMLAEEEYVVDRNKIVA